VLARDLFTSDAAAEIWPRCVDALLRHDHPRVVFSYYILAVAEQWPYFDETVAIWVCAAGWSGRCATAARAAAGAMWRWH